MFSNQIKSIEKNIKTITFFTEPTVTDLKLMLRMCLNYSFTVIKEYS